MYKETLKPSIEVSDYALGIPQGGTESMDVNSAANKLRYVCKSHLGVPGGYAQLNENGLIPQSLAPEGTPPAASITIGPTNTARPGVVNVFQITNYHCFSEYKVSTTLGSVAISRDTISYTPFNHSGTAGFWVNDEFFTVIVGDGGPIQPRIITPLEGAEHIGSSLVFQSTYFSSTNPEDTHEATQWQISLDPNFIVVTIDSGFQSIDKVSYLAKFLTQKKKYYARVRYRGTSGANSLWSTVVTFTTSTRFVASREQAKLIAPPVVCECPDCNFEVDDYFGYAVAISGDGLTAIVGAPQDDPNGKNSGSCYIFTRAGVSWTRMGKIVPDDSATGYYFGSSLSLSVKGDIAVVGAPGEATVAGAVYSFKRIGDIWVQQAKLKASDTHPGDHFGGSLSLSSDASTVVIGAMYNLGTKGCAYVYNRIGTVWVELSRISLEDGKTGDHFGCSVAISGDGTQILVGSAWRDEKSSDGGGVYSYYRVGTNWVYQATIFPKQSITNDKFGISVSLSANGNTAVIGAYGADYKGSESGVAYIFTRTVNKWTEHTILSPTDASLSDMFGNSVCMSLDGTEVVVGAYNKASGMGAGYVFVKLNDKWIQQSKLIANDGATGDWLGNSVSISKDGSHAVVGSYRNDQLATDAGAAYIFA